ncbi:MAG: C4-type zinc ribbon domain-containing protein [Planctomycetota bacterium]
MHPNVKKLIDLQKVDQEIVSLRRDTASLPQEEQKRKRKLEDLERLATERKDRAIKVELDTRALDKAVKQSDDEVKKLNERLNGVRNNAEYQATLFQIESVVRERDRVQDECLKLLDGLEPLKQEAATAAAAVAEERTVFEAFLTEAQKLRAACEARVVGVVEKRKFVAEGIPQDLLSSYERLFATRDGLAVCSVERGFCQGCYNKITTNDTAKLMGGTTVVSCDSCQRILYLPR